MSINESHVEAAAFKWFGKLGYEVGQGPHFFTRFATATMCRFGPDFHLDANRQSR